MGVLGGGMLVFLVALVAWAQEPKDAPQPKTPANETTTKKKFYRQLPQYYKQAADLKQNQVDQIYAIQFEYFQKMAPLEERIDALKMERDAKVQAVLTADQLLRVNAAIAEAKRELEIFGKLTRAQREAIKRAEKEAADKARQNALRKALQESEGGTNKTKP